MEATLSDYDETGPAGDVSSTMRYNGERFPVEMRDFISVQGTSALDTIFDARGTGTSVIRFWNRIVQGSSFVDSLTIRGAASDGGPPVYGLPPYTPAQVNDSGAGISIGAGNRDDAEVAISNCFIVENDVGIAMFNFVPQLFEPGAPTPMFIRPCIVNNTIAWNRIGIYSGNPEAFGAPLFGIGVAQPKILNNVIDPGHPVLGLQITWLGLHPWDLRDLTYGGSPGFESFNAWAIGAPSMGPPIISNFPVSNAGIRPPAIGVPGPPGTPPTTYPTPRVSLQPFMPTQTKPRGVLYVNDAFRASGRSADYSRHDFRLAPHTAGDPRVISGSTPIVDLNPLVNMGMALGTDAAAAFVRSSITFANHVGFWDLRNPMIMPPQPSHNTIDTPPGYVIPASVSEPDSFHAWDWDCEGFGNPRVRCRDGFLSWNSPGTNAIDAIDLGADEMDDLIIAGYVANTRMLARLVSGSPPVDHTEFHFFDLRAGLHPRPLINGWVGFGDNWWNHTWYPNQVASGCLDCARIQGTWLGGVNYDSNYTAAPSPAGSQRNFMITGVNPTLITPPPYTGTSGSQPVFMRNLLCDFSPSLIGDPHPLWGPIWFATFPRGGDMYGSNPWFGADVGQSLGVRTTLPVPDVAPIDNWTVYRNTAHPTYPGGVLDGTINPPGTWKTTVSAAECGSLDQSGYFASAPGPVLSFTCMPTSYSVGIWGFGDSGCPNERAPLLFVDWLGYRLNCQVFEPMRSNLQTFLVVIGEIPIAAPAQSSRSPSPGGAAFDWPAYSGRTLTSDTIFGPEPTFEQRLREMRRLMTWR